MKGVVAAVERALEAVERHRDLNAVIACDAPAALQTAAALQNAVAPRGVLHGLPLMVKDNIATDGFHFTGGSPAFAGYRTAESSAVTRLRQAGAVILGKANLHELAFGVTSANAHTGFVLHPLDPTRLAGGSSGGSAVAVATGMARLSLATDTGGSVRIPAALCGVFGLRPTTGRYPGDGIMTLSPTRDTLGLLAVDLDELAAMDALLAGEAAAPLARPAVLRLGVPRRPFWEHLSEPMDRACEEALAQLQEAGIELIDIDARDIARLDAEIGFPIALWETAEVWRAFVPRALGIGFEAFVATIASPDVRGLFELMLGPQMVPQAAYRSAMQALPALAQAYARALPDGVDAILMPTTVRDAVPVGEAETCLHLGQPVPAFPTFVRQTSPATLARVPSISVPAGQLANGLPFGLMLEALPGRDRQLLAAAARVHAACQETPR